MERGDHLHRGQLFTSFFWSFITCTSPLGFSPGVREVHTAFLQALGSPNACTSASSLHAMNEGRREFSKTKMGVSLLDDAGYLTRGGAKWQHLKKKRSFGLCSTVCVLSQEFLNNSVEHHRTPPPVEARVGDTQVPTRVKAQDLSSSPGLVCKSSSPLPRSKQPCGGEGSSSTSPGQAVWL